MNEKLAGLWAKVVAHKDVAIKAGVATVGALVGLAIASYIASREEVVEPNYDGVNEPGDLPYEEDEE